ncbi:MAG: phosphoribosylaminoimidazolesuccinocarboxamide synthase [Firmicutes bacterium]|nr:phosphoribosylaminoimidazolesuccinocarboxamide synthase [Bacillota bacterium]
MNGQQPTAKPAPAAPAPPAPQERAAVRGPLLYEGKAKKAWQTDDPELLIMEFKDDATAFDGQKRAQISQKGRLNAAISAHFFRLLGARGIPSHFIGQISEREHLVRRVQIVPVEVVVRNVAAGSISRRLGLPEGRELPFPIVEFYYKDDALHDPLINDDHAVALGAATRAELVQLREQALAVNGILRPYLSGLGVILVDFKLEFGRSRGEILLSDEITPDTCRFWDVQTHDHLDKDRFRRDLGGVTEAYEEIWRRLQAAPAAV